MTKATGDLQRGYAQKCKEEGKEPLTLVTHTEQKNANIWRRNAERITASLGRITEALIRYQDEEPMSLPQTEEENFTDRPWEADGGEVTYPRDYACMCLSPHNPIRQFFIRIIEASWFDHLILLAILVNHTCVRAYNNQQ